MLTDLMTLLGRSTNAAMACQYAASYCDCAITEVPSEQVRHMLPLVDRYIRLSEYICMELTVSQVAHAYDRSERLVQLALRSGALAGHRKVGHVTTMDDIAARAWSRSIARGRLWTLEVRDAALDLLSDGHTERLAASERSRLKARLSSLSARGIAHATGGLGAWARYRCDAPSAIARIGPSSVDASQLGIVPGEGWLTFAQTEDLDRYELEHDVTLDPDGNLGVVERLCVDERPARILIDTYLLGDARQSAAAAAELESRRP